MAPVATYSRRIAPPSTVSAVRVRASGAVTTEPTVRIRSTCNMPPTAGVFSTGACPSAFAPAARIGYQHEISHNMDPP